VVSKFRIKLLNILIAGIGSINSYKKERQFSEIEKLSFLHPDIVSRKPKIRIFF